MRRPLPFYLVAAWCCLALLLQASYLTRPAKAYQVAGEPIPVLWTLIPFVALGFAVWQTVGLVRLRRSNRWIAVVFFLCWSAMMVWNVTIELRHSSVKPLRALVVIFTLVSFNLLSAWYLSRRSFRDFAVQFVTERDKENHSWLMQKAAQKRTEEEIRKMRN